MPTNNRSTRKRKIPARLASPSTQIETVTLSQGRPKAENTTLTPEPTTPILSPSSSLSSDTSTPCPAIRAAGSRWRAATRGRLPTRSEIDESPGLPTPPAPMPAQDPEDEHDINSPYFGLQHTPKWHGTRISIDDRAQPRWFPSGLTGPPSLESLSSGSKLILMQELTKRMSFKTLVYFLRLTDPQLINITEVYESEAQRDELEQEYTLAAMKRLDTIRQGRPVTVEDWDCALEEELHAKLAPTATSSPIPLVEIDQTIAYLKTFNVQEDLEGAQLNILDGTSVVLPDDFPSFHVIEQVTEEMRTYARLGVDFEWDFGHEIGLREYIYSETELAGDRDGIVISDDEKDNEAEESVRRPVGHPMKRGRRLADQPILNKSDLLEVRQPSAIAASGERRGRGLEQGRR